MDKTVFLGVEGSGKTTLAMALLRAFDSHKSEGWYMRPLSRDSFRFVETMPRDFLNEGFPAQTADLRELRWQLEWKGEDFGEIEILDYPGEIYRLAFLDEKDERDKEAFRQKVAANKKDIDALLDAIKDAEEVFVLFSLEDAIDIKNKPRNLDAVWITYECLNTLKRLDPKPEIKLLFTQTDKYREAGLDIHDPMLASLDLITRNHGDVPVLNLSVIDSPESEYGIESLLHSLISKSISNVLRKKFGDEIAIDILNNSAEIGKKLVRETKVNLPPQDRETARQYREKIREAALFALNKGSSSIAKSSNSVTDEQLREICWIQEAVSRFLSGKRFLSGNESKDLLEKLAHSNARTPWVEKLRMGLIAAIARNNKSRRFFQITWCFTMLVGIPTILLASNFAASDAKPPLIIFGLEGIICPIVPWIITAVVFPDRVLE